MYNIVCFGDSNTWGFNARNRERFDENTRWPSLLEKMLIENGYDVRIIEEGHNGRTTAFDDPTKDGRNGLVALKGVLHSYRDMDLIIIMLGTNDCKVYYKLTPSQFKNALLSLADTVRELNDSTDILLVSPVTIKEGIKDINEKYDRESEEFSKHINMIYKEVASERDLKCIFADDCTQCSDFDKQHLDERGHRELAQYISDFLIKNILQKTE